MKSAAHSLTPSRFDRDAVQVLRFLFVIGLTCALTLAAYRGQWVGRLRTVDGDFILRLPMSPVWSPPETPKYKTFATSIDQLPQRQVAGSIISQSFLWDRWLAELFLSVWLLMLVIGLLYRATCGRHVDYFLHFVLWSALGVSGGFIVCIGIWSVFGGWGPAPFLLLFPLCGPILGVGSGGLRLFVRHPKANNDRRGS